MKLFLTTGFLFFMVICFAQPKLTKLASADIPRTIAYEGNIANAVSWIDSAGKHFVIISELLKKNAESDNLDATVYGYHFLKVKGDSIKLIWKVYDFVSDCPVDVRAAFIKNSFAITDLDNDKEPEVWMMYKTYCRGDVSPSIMKIIMYENDKKYAMRGRTKVQFSQKDYEGGEYNFDESFIRGPESFKNYGKKLWLKNIKETWE